ncbi:NUDIX hydrolase [Aminipila butyrica]|uniref:NUDIX hydrolase n=1 Tax=Aminipila butyrica TaxID=433296 RepID=A0A858BUW7_9FIRM|nr:NUDIX hydrolase [Aminipila butyrica]QIB68865.1 NUDIX hydrolase [Aminipila butyrica]
MTFEEKTISSEMIYQGAILNLRRDKVQVIGGGTSHREIVEHNGGVAMIAVKEDGKVLLVRQFRKPVEKVVLEVPAGKIEKGEDPYETAVRELKEETGYTAEQVQFLTKFYPSVGYSQEVLYIYLCTGLTAGETAFDEHEALDILEMDLDQLFKMTVNGEIEDGKTAIAIMQAWAKLKLK